MFYQNQYKKLHLLSYVCLLGSFFLAPVLRAESSAIKNEEGVRWLRHARSGEVEEMKKLLEENPSYLTWQDPSDGETALIAASRGTQVEAVKMVLSRLSKEQTDYLNVKFEQDQKSSFGAIFMACFLNKEVENQEKAAMIVEAIINTAKQYKIKLDLTLDKGPAKSMNALMLVCNISQNFKIAELFLDSYKEIGLDLNASIDENIGGEKIQEESEQEKKDREFFEKFINYTALTFLVEAHLEDKEIADAASGDEDESEKEAAAKGQEDSLADQMKKRKEIIKKLLHLGAHLDEKSKSIAEKDSDLLQLMEDEVKQYKKNQKNKKFWKNVKIGAWITGGIVLLASLIGGAYWFFIQKPKSESQKA